MVSVGSGISLNGAYHAACLPACGMGWRVSSSYKDMDGEGTQVCLPPGRCIQDGLFLL